MSDVDPELEPVPDPELELVPDPEPEPAPVTELEDTSTNGFEVVEFGL